MQSFFFVVDECAEPSELVSVQSQVKAARTGAPAHSLLRSGRTDEQSYASRDPWMMLVMDHPGGLAYSTARLSFAGLVGLGTGARVRHGPLQ